MRGIRSRSGLTYALKYAASFLRQGIGISKRQMYEEHDKRSPYIHSYSTFNRYMGIAKEFVGWAKERGINRLDQVRYSHVREFLQEKAERGLTEKTMKVNASALGKFFNTVGRDDIYKDLRRDYTEIYTSGRPSVRALPFSNPDKVIENLREPVHRVVAELQYLTGARVGDVKKIEVDTERKFVVIDKSKGGRYRELDFRDRLERFERVVELKAELDRMLEQRDWSDIRKGYYEDLKQAVKKAGEVYTGSHAFRVTYAVERFEELREKGLEPEKADKVLTEELGHSRIDMSRYYRY